MKWEAIKVAYEGYDKYVRVYKGEFLKWKFEPSKEGDYFYIEAATDNAYILFNSSNSIIYNYKNILEYSYNKIKWHKLSSIPKTQTGYIQLPSEGDRIYFRNVSESIVKNSSSSQTLFASGDKSTNVKIGGDLHTIMFKHTDKIYTLNSYNFTYLFDNIPTLIDASDLILPATTLGYRSYCRMFRNCYNLKYAPKQLSVMTFTNQESCELMFENCYNLLSVPELPATTLGYGCYKSMFKNCTSLNTVPELPATTLDEMCYLSMFQGCTSLTKAPELPALTLTDYCYYGMFQGCSSLNYIKCLATDISANNSTRNWVYGVPRTGEFVKHPDATWSSGVNGIPGGWTIIDYDIISE